MGKHINKPPLGPDDGKIGYRKPPPEHKFPEGASGNPRGRPTGAKGLKTDLKSVLAKVRTITINGQKLTGRSQWLMLETLAIRGSHGDLRAIAQLLPLIAQVLGNEDRDTDANRLSPNDEALLERVMSRREAERKTERPSPRAKRKLPGGKATPLPSSSALPEPEAPEED